MWFSVSAICFRMKLEPMKPAPPVIIIFFNYVPKYFFYSLTNAIGRKIVHSDAETRGK